MTHSWWLGRGKWVSNLWDKSGAGEVNQFMLALSELMYFDKVPKTENSLSLANGEGRAARNSISYQEAWMHIEYLHPVTLSRRIAFPFLLFCRFASCSLGGVWRQTPKVERKKQRGAASASALLRCQSVWRRHGKRRFRRTTVVRFWTQITFR